MDERSRRVLEFPEIIERLAAETTFAPGRELASQLLPETDPDEVRRRLAETAEALKFVDEAGTVLAGARDVRPAVARARIGGVLSGSELLDVAATAACAGRLRRIFLAEPETCPQLAAHALRLGTFAELEEAITACIGPDGQVIDDASPTLKRLRADIRAAQSRVRERLDAVVRSANLRPALQEPLVTVRNGRPVVPVKQEHKHLIPGVVHDTSASGATVFVEPLVVFELNNELQELRVREAREVDRILARLSAQAGEAADALLATVESLARIDLAMAKARLARSMRAVAPKMNEDSFIRIAGGRHPLLPGEPVPIDVRLGRDIRALVITGPNTGGKTVTLKTIGLFSLMAQAGLFVPAEPGTELAIFRGIYADIGDEQSIQQNLSTFSSHMSNIVAILRQAGPGCLVLLDELGAGTDPAEGAALAMAILDHLSGAGALCVATSHYSELKAFAHSRPGMENASVEFDPDTLRPTYRLQMGLPGRSMALAVAARLGLPGEVLENARGRLAREDLRVDELIHNLEASRREAEAELATARRLRADAEQLKAKLDAARREWEARRDERLEQARAQARAVLDRARREADRLLSDIRRYHRQAELKKARQARAELQARMAELDAAASATGTPDIPAGGPVESPEPGQTVLVSSLAQVGTVLQRPDGDGHVTVQIGGLRVRVPVKDLRAAPARQDAEAAGRPPARQTGAVLAAEKRAAVSPEVHLRGMTVDEALAVLEKYLDDAVLAGLSAVRVIHGKGTGTLRRAIQDYLRGHPAVESWRLADTSAGGAGVTVVELRS